MKPVLDDGDFVVALTIRPKPKLNRLLVVDHSEYGVIIKRVIGVEADGSCWLGSDNPRGVSSSQLGKVSPEQILGLVLWCIRR
ncbi:MAG: peptidase S24 [Proteobacteria bacterium]|nr:MAG: peptidase S24 [Pseudomonadota bacterium]